MAKQYGFGIIGCGVIAKVHLEQIKNIGNAKLIAVADNEEIRARQLGESEKVDWYTDYREMLKREDIDIVNIVTPSGMHAQMTIDAARAGKHVIVEKPMDIQLDKAKQMIQACHEAGVKLTVISQHRFDPSTVQVKQQIEDGSFGELVLGQAEVHWYRSQSYYDSGAWRGTWELDGGGSLMNQSIHTIDLLQYLMGPIESVYAHTATLAHERIEVEDVAVATVKFRNGGLGTIVGTTSAYPGFSAKLHLFGTNGSAIIDRDKLTHMYIRADGDEERAYGGGETNNLANDVQSESANGGAADPGAISASSHRLQFLDMIRAIEEGKEPVVNGEEGIKPLEIILAIYESARRGCPIKIGDYVRQ